MQIKTDKFSEWYQAHMEKYIPSYAFFSLISCFAVNCLVYWATQLLASGMYHYDLTTAFDRAVPFVPQWVSIYILSYPFWVISYALTSKHNSKEFWYRFVFADILARIVCGIIFVAFPTTNIRPETAGSGLLDLAMDFIYIMDEPYNLFPSIHCLASLMCYLGIRKCADIPRWYRLSTLLFAILIFASTQFTKQHYIVDVAGGIAVALICFAISMGTNGYKKLMACFDRLNQKVFGEVIDEE